MNFKKITEGIIRVYTENYFSLLTRYSEINENIQNKYSDFKVILSENEIDFDGINIRVQSNGNGYKLEFEVDESDIFYGLGDSSRNSLSLENKKYLLETSNITCYGPNPILINLKGWAIFINTTYSSLFDIRSENNKQIKILVKDGMPDFYLIKAKTFKNLLSAITDLTGKPTMLPAFGYGLTIVQNERTDANQLLSNVRTVRDKEISCDIFGLEPYWMNQYYDLSVDKEWNKELFRLPSWHDKSYCGPQSFFYPIRDNGMNLSLWLCENYDLYFEEERKLGQNIETDKTNEWSKETVDFDSHLNNPCYTDKITKIDEKFFKHLEKFVDNGASSFKLDGYTQVLKHPDRYWGMKYHDDEIHNLYPLTLAKQMQQGFKEYTGRRPVIYTSGSYVGIQKYAATWSGDTGGGIKPLTSVLQHALVGHTNATIDMDITNISNLHYGFLLSWTELDVWSYYFYPWNMSSETEKIFKFYSNLRSSLFPYIYMNAHSASVSGVPIVRPMILEYENELKYKNTVNSFMLGDNLLVSIPNNKVSTSASADYVDSKDFKSDKYENIEQFEIDLPEGTWVDFFNGKEYSGKILYKLEKEKGGALFAKKDSVLVTMKPQKYILEKKHNYVINVFGTGKTTLYEDDGFTFDYENGGYQETLIEAVCNKKDCSLTISPTKGEFKGRPNNGHDLVNNSIPKISGANLIESCDVVFHNMIAKKAYLNGKETKFEIDGVNTKISLNEKFDKIIDLKIEQ